MNVFSPTTPTRQGRRVLSIDLDPNDGGVLSRSSQGQPSGAHRPYRRSLQFSPRQRAVVGILSDRAPVERRKRAPALRYRPSDRLSEERSFVSLQVRQQIVGRMFATDAGRQQRETSHLPLTRDERASHFPSVTKYKIPNERTSRYVKSETVTKQSTKKRKQKVLLTLFLLVRTVQLRYSKLESLARSAATLMEGFALHA